MNASKAGYLPLGILACAGFLSVAGARIIDPLLNVIAGDFATTVPAVSIVITAFTLPYGLNQMFLGPIGDRFGKLRVMLAALIGYALATGACALAGNLATLTVLRVFAGATSAGLIPVALAYIGDAVPYAERQVTISRFLLGSVMAMILSGPIGGLFGGTIGWRGVFLLLSAGAIAVAAFLAMRMPSLPDRRDPRAGFSMTPYLSLLALPEARRLLIAALLDGMVMPGSFPFIAPYLQGKYALSYGLTGLVLACFGLGALGYTRLARHMLRRLGEPGMVFCGGLLVSAALWLGMAVSDWRIFIPVEIALGLGFLMLHSVLQARATEMLPTARSTAVSGFVVALFLGQALGAAGMGALIGAVGYRAAFRLDAALILLVALWLSAGLRGQETPLARVA